MKRSAVLTLLVLAAVVIWASVAYVQAREEIKLTTIVPDQTTALFKKGVVGTTYLNTYRANPDSIPDNVLYVEGNVSVGTIAVPARLDVVGQVKITDGNQGAGKVLTSDASGLATWQVPPATPPITIITCATKTGGRGGYGFIGPTSAACPAGTLIRFFAETGHAEYNTDWNDDQYCKTWVSQAMYGITCHAEGGGPGCGNSGMGVCW